MHALELSAGELKTLQDADTSLDMPKKASDGHPNSAGAGFMKNELLYRRWNPPGQEDPSMAVEQLVLPLQCRKEVLRLAHNIPLSGHLGKNKTARRILQRFYWPTVYHDVAEYCLSCAICQKTSQQRGRRAPLIPLPIIEETFSRIAMDIVGPLPRRRTGNSYVLVVCDYATR